jgi:hypothetical protein
MINFIKSKNDHTTGIIYIFGLLLVIFIFGFSGCNETTSTQDEAILMTLDEIRNTPGYDWFQPNYGGYNPDKQITDEIKNTFNPVKNHFITFVNPSCACTGTQILFPQLMKILTESGVPESKILIYSLNTVNTKNPYSNLIKLHQLPSLFSVKDSTIKYSVTDTLSLIQELYPDSLVSLEQLILYSIQK